MSNPDVDIVLDHKRVTSSLSSFPHETLFKRIKRQASCVVGHNDYDIFFKVDGERIALDTQDDLDRAIRNAVYRDFYSLPRVYLTIREGASLPRSERIVDLRKRMSIQTMQLKNEEIKSAELAEELKAAEKNIKQLKKRIKKHQKMENELVELQRENQMLHSRIAVLEGQAREELPSVVQKQAIVQKVMAEVANRAGEVMATGKAQVMMEKYPSTLEKEAALEAALQPPVHRHMALLGQSVALDAQPHTPHLFGAHSIFEQNAQLAHQLQMSRLHGYASIGQPVGAAAVDSQQQNNPIDPRILAENIIRENNLTKLDRLVAVKTPEQEVDAAKEQDQDEANVENDEHDGDDIAYTTPNHPTDPRLLAENSIREQIRTMIYRSVAAKAAEEEEAAAMEQATAADDDHNDRDAAVSPTSTVPLKGEKTTQVFIVEPPSTLEEMMQCEVREITRVDNPHFEHIRTGKSELQHKGMPACHEEFMNAALNNLDIDLNLSPSSEQSEDCVQPKSQQTHTDSTDHLMEQERMKKVTEMNLITFWERMAAFSVKFEAIGEKMKDLDARVDQFEEGKKVAMDRVNDIEAKLENVEERVFCCVL